MNSLPEDFKKRIVHILPQTTAWHFNTKPLVAFRINTLKISLEEAFGLLSQASIDYKKVPWCSYAVLVSKGTAHALLNSDLVKRGLLYAQGLESMLAVMALEPTDHQQVLDLCAGPGSKTTQIAMLMNNTGTLIANEPIKDRFFRLKSVVNLLGAQAKLTCIDGRRMHPSGIFFDRILVDAPCSCEGRFCVDDRKSFAYWSLRKIKEMSHKQKGLLLSASRLLGPGGILIYATCTFAPEENEEVVDWFLQKTQGRVRLTPINIPVETYPCLTSWQGRLYKNALTEAVRILPGEAMEGFFIAKFVNSYYK